MKVKVRRLGFRVASLAMVVGLTCGISLAQPAGAGAAKQIATASVASIDKVRQLAIDAGLGEIPFLSADFIEQKLPFIGPGGLDAARPIGVAFYAGPNVTPEQGAVIVLPVKQGKATLEPFVQQGAQPVAGQPDTVTAQGATFRRTPDYFVFGTVTDPVKAIDVKSISTPHGKPDSLVSISVDLASMRTAMPDRFTAFVDQIDQQAKQQNGEAGEFGAQLVTMPLRTLDKAAISLDRPAGGLRMALAFSPVKLNNAAPARAARPGFPQGVVARADIAYPPKQLQAQADAIVTQLFTGDQREFKNLTPAQRKQAAAFLSHFAGIFLSGDSVSLAVGPHEGKPVVYVAMARADAQNLGAQIKQVVTESEGVAKMMNEPAILKLEEYPADADKVWRLHLFNNGNQMATIDILARGNMAYATIGGDDTKLVSSLPALKAEGNMSGLASGWIDLEAILKIAGEQPGNPLAAKPEAERKALMDLVQGQRLNWGALLQGDTLQLDLTMPPKLLSNIAQLIQAMQ